MLGCAYILEHHWLHWWEINHNPKIQPVLKMYPAFRILNNFFKKKWNSHNLLQNTKKVTRKNTYGRGQGAGGSKALLKCCRSQRTVTITNIIQISNGQMMPLLSMLTSHGKYLVINFQWLNNLLRLEQRLQTEDFTPFKSYEFIFFQII